MEFKKQNIKNPYPGIRSFEISESHLFFGREKQISELSEIIQKTHFIAVTGASGSGKSSLIKAGLISFLMKDEGWNYVIFRPGNSPVKNLAKSIFDVLNKSGIDKKISGTTKSIENTICSDKNPICNILENVNYNQKLLIYIDQFEEIFRYKQNEEEETAIKKSNIFVNTLIEASQQKNSKVYIVITLRTDFLSDCTNFKGLPELINKGHYLIPKMTIEEKELALTKPAMYAGAEISSDLKTTITRHIKDFGVSLPVFQHSLMRTWDYWIVNADYGKPINTEHYEAIGTVKNALSIHAEIIYSSLQTKEKKKIAEKVFKILTFLGDDARGTRRPSSVHEICEISGAKEQDVIDVIDKFRDDENSFLFPNKSVKLSLNTVVDISHESIMHVWKRLVDWVNEETKSAQMYLRLSRSAELYQEGKSGLLVNPDLQLALKWLDDNKPNEAWAMRYDASFSRVLSYINYSKKEHDKKIKAIEENQKLKLKRTKFIAIILGAASLISILFLIVALNLKFKAEDSEKNAKLNEKIAIEKGKIAEIKQKEAISHKLIAIQQQQIAEQQRLLAEEQKRFAVIQQREANRQKAIALDATQIAIIEKNKAQKLQNEAEVLKDKAIKQKQIAEQQKSRAEQSEAKTDTLRRLSIAKTLAIQAINTYRNNKKSQNLSEEDKNLPLILALQSYNFNKKYKKDVNSSELFAALSEVAETKQVIRDKNSHNDAIRDIAITKTGKLLTCSDDGTIKLFNLKSIPKSQKLNVTGNNNQAIRAIAISNNEKTVIAGNYKGKILVWKNGLFSEKPIILSEHNQNITKLIFIDDNKFLSSSKDGKVILWNNFIPKQIFKTSNPITTIAKNPTNNFLAIAHGNKITVIDLSDTKFQKTKDINKGRITAIIWNDNNDIDIGLASGEIIIRGKKEQQEIFAHSSGITSMQYNSKNNQLITCSYDGKIKIWDYNDFSKAPIVLNNHNSWIYTIALSYDNKKLISGSADKNIVISDIDIEELKSKIQRKVSKNMSKENWLKYVGEGIEYSENLPDF